MDMRKIVETAKQKLIELTGFTSPNAIGVKKEGDIWHITIEIIEKPSAAVNLEVLGIYDVQLDASGNFFGYERIRMRKRCDIQKE